VELEILICLSHEKSGGCDGSSDQYNDGCFIHRSGPPRVDQGR
jgi:hypothetical protein